MKILETNFALIIGALSNVFTFLLTTYISKQKRKASLENSYTDLLQKYAELSNKYVEIIDRLAQFEITNQTLKHELEILTAKQCTQCQPK